MKRPNRNIEIFSMSVLDLFASALGGFILITIILFPNYGKKEQIARDIAQAKAKLTQIQERADSDESRLRAAEIEKERSDIGLAQCKAADTDLQQALATKEPQVREAETERRQLASCQAALSDTFLMVAIQWSAGWDVDLHIIDPEGHEFYWNKNNRERRDYPESEAQLSYDTVKGPGIELWQDPRAHPGTYQIHYHSVNYLGAIEIKGNVFYRNGRKELPAVTLNTGAGTPTRHVADIVVGQSGNVDVRPLP